MDPVLEKVNITQSDSFLVEQLSLDHFRSPWHYHPEHEILLVTAGYGTLLAGDHIGRFKAGDIAIIGGGLPHVWMNDPEFYRGEDELKAGAIYIQFQPDFWGEKFSNLPEMELIRLLLRKSERGLWIAGGSKNRIGKMIREIAHTKGIECLLLLMRILDTAARSMEDHYELSSAGFTNKPSDIDHERINRIHQYICANYERKISLEEAAKLINLSPVSFCRYFKSRTNKTFSRFVNEIRIGHACKMLIENKLSVTEICYRSGFNHFSSFHKQFRAVKGTSPLKYRKNYLKRS